jgi:hypothetical protein
MSTPLYESFAMILPVFNEETRVRRVIEYYRTYARIIAVDNNSSDRTVAILKELGIPVVGHTNEGTHQTTEDVRFFLSLAETPYVLFLSCSEFIPASLLAKFDRIAREGFYEVVSNPRGGIYTGGRLIPLWGGRFGIYLRVERLVKRDGVDLNRIRIHGHTYPINKDRLLILPREPDNEIISLRDADTRYLLAKSIDYASVEARQKIGVGEHLTIFGLAGRFLKEIIRFLLLTPRHWNGIALREIWARCVMHTTIYWLDWEAKTGENLDRSRAGSEALWEELIKEQK